MYRGGLGWIPYGGGDGSVFLPGCHIGIHVRGLAQLNMVVMSLGLHSSFRKGIEIWYKLICGLVEGSIEVPR